MAVLLTIITKLLLSGNDWMEENKTKKKERNPGSTLRHRWSEKGHSKKERKPLHPPQNTAHESLVTSPGRNLTNIQNVTLRLTLIITHSSIKTETFYNTVIYPQYQFKGILCH